MKMTLWDKVLGWFGVETTWEWCLIGCTIGRHSWYVSLEKCHNGTPVISGGFLWVIKYKNKEDAEKDLANYKEIADDYNKDHGYWV